MMHPFKWRSVASIVLGVLVFGLSLVMSTITSAWVLYVLVFGDDDERFGTYAIWSGIAFAIVSTWAYWRLLAWGRVRALAITLATVLLLCVLVWFGTVVVDEML